MPIPFAVPLAMGGASLLGGLLSRWLGGGQRQRGVQYAPGAFPQRGGYQSMQMPGGGTLAQIPRFTPEQQSALSQLLSQGLGGMRGLPTAEFGPIRKAAETQFQQEIVPGIAERFTGLGAGGQRSSAFAQALGGAGAGLAERLAGMEQQFGMQQRGQDISRLLSMLQMGLQPQFEQVGFPRQPGFLESFGTQAVSGLGALAPLLAMRYLG